MPGLLKYIGRFIKPSNRLYWRILLLLTVLSLLLLFRDWIQTEGCHYLPGQLARYAMLNHINMSEFGKEPAVDQNTDKILLRNSVITGKPICYDELKNIHISRWVKLNDRMRVYQLEVHIKNGFNQPAILVAGSVFLKRSAWTWQVESMVIQPIQGKRYRAIIVNDQ